MDRSPILYGRTGHRDGKSIRPAGPFTYRRSLPPDRSDDERRAGLIYTVVAVGLAAFSTGLIIGAGLFGAFGGQVVR